MNIYIFLGIPNLFPRAFLTSFYIFYFKIEFKIVPIILYFLFYYQIKISIFHFKIEFKIVSIILYFLFYYQIKMGLLNSITKSFYNPKKTVLQYLNIFDFITKILLLKLVSEPLRLSL